MQKIIMLISLLLTICLGAGVAFSGHGGNGRQRQRYQEGRSLGQQWVPPVSNPLYQRQCGECHMAYQPALLPAASWEAILAKLPEHFGEQVEFTSQDRAAVAAYLRSNAAEYCDCKISRKILKSLRGETVLRISQVPYILHQHEDDDIPTGAFARKAVGSRGNCLACHPTADQGCYNEDLARVPR